MSKLLKRLGMKKVVMDISLSILEIYASPAIENDFYIMWQRGPQIDATEITQMEKGTTSVAIMEMFNKTSTFYEGKNGKFQKKTCDFRIFENDRVIAPKEFDMSS